MFFGVFEIFPLVLVAAVLVALFAGRSEPDPDRERPTALYLSIVSFFAVLFVLGSTVAITMGVMGLTGDGSYSFGSGENVAGYAPIPRAAPTVSIKPGFAPYPMPPAKAQLTYGRYHANHDGDVSTIVTGLIVGLLALGVFRSSFGKARRLGAGSSGPGARVLARYCYAVCFVTLLAGLAGAGIAIHSLFGVIAPDTFNAGSNAESARVLADSAVVALVALALFRLHSEQAQGFSAPPRSVGFAAPTPTAPPAPSTPPAPPAKKAPAAKKAPPRRT